jgi:MFS transporter, NNP family, nitrate/nitrite transporter
MNQNQPKRIGVIEALKSGDPKTLFAAFLYFDTGFTVWLLLGALAPFLAEALNLTDGQKGFMVAIPVLAAAIIRISFGLAYQAFEAKKIATVGILMSALPLFYVQFFSVDYTTMLILGAFLGIGGASFAVALPMAGSNYPPQTQGLVLGLAAAGNLGAVLDGILFPPLAKAFGWAPAMGFAAILLAITLFVVIAWAKDKGIKKPEMAAHASVHFVVNFLFFIVATVVLSSGTLGIAGKTGLLMLPAIASFLSITLLPKAYKALLAEKDIWIFILIYAITFGGFVGMSSYVSLFLISQYHLDKLTAGMFMSLFALTGAMIRPIGGYIADKVTGVRALFFILASIAVFDGAIGLFMPESYGMTVFLLIGLFASFGLGNGATFQLAPQRWPHAMGIVTGLVGAAGGIGGFYLPAILGLVKESTGTYNQGFLIFAVLSLIALGALALVHSKWMEWAHVHYDEIAHAIVGDKNGHEEMIKIDDEDHLLEKKN